MEMERRGSALLKIGGNCSRNKAKFYKGKCGKIQITKYLAGRGRQVDKKFKEHSLIDKVYKRLNLYIAYEKVKANRGKGGVDKVSLEEYERNLEQNLEEVHRLLYEDKYEPMAVKRVYIPKSNGDKRPLGIPTIRDRVVQQALLNRLGKIFERKFCDCSYGFRPQRSCREAIEKVDQYLRSGHQWVVEVDISKFFDTVDQDKLMRLVYEEISDGRVLRLIGKFLKAGVMEEGKITLQTRGTPQGGNLSPLLANIYLHPYDEEMIAKGYNLVRYADDIVILCKTKQEAEGALILTRQILEGCFKLRLNFDKTKLTHEQAGFEFLGHYFGCGYSHFKTPRKKTVDAFRNKIRRLTRRLQPKKMTTVIEEMNPVIRGWGQYFVRSNCRGLFGNLDRWIAHRLSAFKLRKWGGYGHKKYNPQLLKQMGLIFLLDILEMS